MLYAIANSVAEKNQFSFLPESSCHPKHFLMSSITQPDDKCHDTERHFPFQRKKQEKGRGRLARNKKK